MNEARAELRRIGDKELKKAFRAQMKTAVEPVRRRAVVEAPVGPTKRLRKTIKTQAADRGAKIKAGTPGRVPYAGRVHWGKTTRHPKGQQFFTEALRKRFAETQARISSVVRGLFDNVGDA